MLRCQYFPSNFHCTFILNSNFDFLIISVVLAFTCASWQKVLNDFCLYNFDKKSKILIPNLLIYFDMKFNLKIEHKFCAKILMFKKLYSVFSIWFANTLTNNILIKHFIRTLALTWRFHLQHLQYLSILLLLINNELHLKSTCYNLRLWHSVPPIWSVLFHRFEKFNFDELFCSFLYSCMRLFKPI